MALRISIGGIAKRRGFFAMSVGYDGKVLIPLWFVGTLSTRTVIWWMKQCKMVRFHRYFVLRFLRTEICCMRLLSRIVVTYHIFSLILE